MNWANTNSLTIEVSNSFFCWPRFVTADVQNWDVVFVEPSTSLCHFKVVISQNFKLLVWIANITYFHFWYLTDTQLPPIRFHKLLHGFHNAHNQELVNSEFLEGSFVFRAIHEPNYYRNYRHNVHWGCNYLIVVTCDFIIYTVLNC